jgi:hypothetical protein
LFSLIQHRIHHAPVRTRERRTTAETFGVGLKYKFNFGCVRCPRRVVLVWTCTVIVMGDGRWEAQINREERRKRGWWWGCE